MASSDGLPESIEEFCTRTIRGFEEKADHNKNESLWTFILVIACTLVAPLFVTLGEGLWFGKVIPSFLSLLAGGGTTWLQLRKPQQLWALYRSCQRELEDERTKHFYKLGRYVNEDRDKLLAEKVAEVAMAAHHAWLPMVPNPEHLGKFTAADKGVLKDAVATQQ